MSLTLNTKAYAYDSTISQNSVQHVGPNNSLSIIDRLDLKRVKPKPTNDYAGQGKATVKMTRSMTDGVSSDVVGNGIFELNMSLPVGTAVAEQQAFLDDFASWLSTSEATNVFLDLDISHL